MYRYPPALAELTHIDAERAARLVAYRHDEGAVVVEVFDSESALLGRTITGLTGCLEVTVGLVLDGSPIEYRRAPSETSLGGQPAIAGAVVARHAQRA